MIITCADSHAGLLERYLEQEYVFNTFLLADLRLYGASAPFQDTWADVENGVCRAVYMRFYQNLMVYGEAVDGAFVRSLLKRFPISVIMGKQELVERLSGDAGDGYILRCKRLCMLEGEDALQPDAGRARRAEPADAGRIHRFLQSLPEFTSLYASGEMIADRIRNNDGIHLMLEQDGEIVSHGNSTAGAGRTVMLGGVGTAPAFRGRGYASEIVSALSRAVLAGGKKPCVFCGRGPEENLFDRLGFRTVGGWATLEAVERTGIDE